MAHQAARAWGDLQRFRHHLESEVRDTVLGETPTPPAQTTDSEPAAPTQRDESGPEMIGSSGEEPERLHPGLD
jgi:hypothetical protein